MDADRSLEVTAPSLGGGRRERIQEDGDYNYYHHYHTFGDLLWLDWLWTSGRRTDPVGWRYQVGTGARSARGHGRSKHLVRPQCLPEPTHTYTCIRAVITSDKEVM